MEIKIGQHWVNAATGHSVTIKDLVATWDGNVVDVQVQIEKQHKTGVLNTNSTFVWVDMETLEILLKGTRLATDPMIEVSTFGKHPVSK